MGAVPKVLVKRHILMEAEPMERLGAANLGQRDKINMGIAFPIAVAAGHNI